MTYSLFSGKKRIKARALYVGHRIDLRALETSQRLGSTPLVINAGTDGCAILFRYGAVVLFELNAIEELNFLNELKHLIIDPQTQLETEEIELLIDPDLKEGVDQTRIVLNNFAIERLQLVADVLAKNVVLGCYEGSITQNFDRIEPLAAAMQHEGKIGNQAVELIRHIGDNLSIQAKMVGRAEVSDKPDLLWEHPELERLYHTLENEYELSERHRALERKLDLISRTAETLLSLLQNRRSLRVEWYIVILIVVEVILTLYELFFRH